MGVTQEFTAEHRWHMMLFQFEYTSKIDIASLNKYIFQMEVCTFRKIKRRSNNAFVKAILNLENDWRAIRR